MKIGKVIGNVWATKKDEKLNGQKLLVLKLLSPSGKETEECLVASGIVGAGAGDLVLVVFGAAARYGVLNPDIPIDAAIVGIIDKVEIDDVE